MFVTPHIIVHPDLSGEDADRYQMLERERGSFLKQMEKEKQKRLGKQQKHALLVGPNSSDSLSLAGQNLLEDTRSPLDISGEEAVQDAEENKDYIYSW